MRVVLQLRSSPIRTGNSRGRPRVLSRLGMVMELMVRRPRHRIAIQISRGTPIIGPLLMTAIVVVVIIIIITTMVQYIVVGIITRIIMLIRLATTAQKVVVRSKLLRKRSVRFKTISIKDRCRISSW